MVNMNEDIHIENKEPFELKQMIKSLLIQQKVDKAEIRRLEEQVRSLQAALFGRKSEKGLLLQNEPSLFDMLDEETELEKGDDSSEAEEDSTEVKAHKRKKSGRKPIPENLPRTEVIHDISDEEKMCSCGCMKKCIGEETSEQIDIIPAQVNVIRHVFPKYACSNCEGVEDEGPTVSMAHMPDQIIPKCIGTPGLIAYVLIAKFVDAIPFYRQEKQLLRIGVKISRATMCNWARKVAESFEILLTLLKQEILSGPLINIDETTVQVLREPGRSSQTKSYMWVFKGALHEKPAILFEYHPSRKGDVANKFLGNYQGVVQTDGYVGYDFLDSKKGVSHMACMAHVRRKFHAVIQAAGNSTSKDKEQNGVAGKAMKFIRKLYRLQRSSKKMGLSNEELIIWRNEHAKPVMDEFKGLLDNNVDNAPPKGLLGKAISYALNQWDRLNVWLKSPETTLDNNLVENAIRPFALGRKNWLFSVTPDGANASAAIFSILETAKANGLEPYWYFRYLLENLPEAMTEDDFKALLPQYIDPSLLDGPP